MGTGNLTELTDADSGGVTAVLARHLLGARDPQCAGRAGQPAYAAHDRGARRGAAHHVCGARRTAACRGLRQRAAADPRPKPFPDTPDEIAEAARPRCATPISASRSPRTASTSTTAQGHHVAQDAFALFAKLGVEARRRACLLSRRRADEGRDRLAPRQALCAGRAARLGLRGRRRPRRTDPRLQGGRAHAARQVRKLEMMPMIRETIVTTVSAAGDVHIAPLGIIAGRRRLDHRAVPPVAHARQSARGAVRRGELHRRRARLRRLPDGPARLADCVPRKRARAAPRRRAGARGTRASAAIVEDDQRPRFHCRVVQTRLACAVRRLQSRPGGGDRSRHPGQPPDHAAAREGRGRNGLSRDRDQPRPPDRRSKRHGTG